MNYSDLLNGIFELVGALFVIPSVKDLLKKKKVAGINWKTTGFFTLWGLWNILFYTLNGLIFSFIGGLVLAAVNIFWLTLLIKYNEQ